MKLASTAFGDGDRIPARHTADGPDLSPRLSWSDPPAGTVELALIVDDPDAPRAEPWVHWVLYGIPGDCRELPEGIARTPTPSSPVGIRQGVNSFSDDRIGYRGPAPPKGHGPHHYGFALYALDAAVDLAPGATKEALLGAMDGHVLAGAKLTGVYER